MELQRGGQVPFFDLLTLEGRRVDYRDVWQRRPLALVRAPAGGTRFAGLTAQLRQRVTGEVEIVVTDEEVVGLPPGVLVADRWGEIHHVAPLGPSSPDLDDLADWVRFVQIQCPECEGEAR